MGFEETVHVLADLSDEYLVKPLVDSSLHNRNMVRRIGSARNLSGDHFQGHCRRGTLKVQRLSKLLIEMTGIEFDWPHSMSQFNCSSFVSFKADL
jgi:hypothetical protein